jgi:ribosomal protein S18 acetylase RimI-like enzyme
MSSKRKKNPSELIAAEIPVEQAPWADLTPAAEMLYRAFADNPMMRFMASVARSTNHAVRENFTYVLQRARVNGIITRTSARYEGVAVWFLQGFARSNFALDSRIAWYMLRSYRLRDIQSLLPFYVKIEQAHERIIRQPHYYLEILGVDPQYQGQGFSSKLLRPVLSHADQHRKTCYLETQSPNNVSLYQHFGFEVMDTIPVDFDPVPYTLMLRKPVPQNSYFFGS